MDYLEKYIGLCDGNPGAMRFLAEAVSVDPIIAIRVLSLLEEYDIRGDKIYILWNDCCDRKTEFTMHVLLTKSIAEIKEHINYGNIRGILFDELKEEE